MARPEPGTRLTPFYGTRVAGGGLLCELVLVPYLTREFFARPCLEVAPDLLGCHVVHQIEGGPRRAGRIVEVEAYLGDGRDPGSHSHRGATPRNRAMFGPPGRFYAYRSMGLHVCVNVVCEPEGCGAAVLLRAVEPLAGEPRMRRARGGLDGVTLTNGPGKLTQAFGITLEHDGRSALRGRLRIEAPPAPTELRILTSPRIGLSRGTELFYRFCVDGSRYVTRSPLNRRARPLRLSSSWDQSQPGRSHRSQ